MAWSPVRRTNAGRFEVDHPEDYATLNSYHSSDATLEVGSGLSLILIKAAQSISDETQYGSKNRDKPMIFLEDCIGMCGLDGKHEQSSRNRSAEIGGQRYTERSDGAL